MSAPSRSRPPRLLLLLLLLAAPAVVVARASSSVPRALQASEDESRDFYCGTTWPDAADRCPLHCPSGLASECVEALGPGHGCYKYTGCDAKVGAQNAAAVGDGEDATGTQAGGSGNDNFCGSSWIEAMRYCSVPCPRGYECADGSTCFAATNCNRPLQRLRADMLVTLTGADAAMEDEDGEIFGSTMQDILKAAVEDEGVALNEVDLGEQSVTGRRELQKRFGKDNKLKGWHEEGGTMDRASDLKVEGVNRRRLPSGSSALDVSMVVTGDYRPPPYLDLNVIAQDSINRQGEKVVSTLRERGERQGRSFFERVDGIEAVARDAFTGRPTNKPTPYPTLSPTVTLSELPSSPPTEHPTDIPSESPTLSHDQAIMTGSTEDLQLGGTTTSSYGYLFNMRTRAGSGVVVVNGLDFYTESTEMVNYELWTRLGTFKGHKGTYEGWDLMAQGTVKGRGIGRYTSLPDETLTEVSIPGGGGEEGTRAFYLTLDSKELVYKIGTGTASDSAIQYETEDVEVWEGESVLFYPFPSPEDFFYYRFPRQFLGTIRYDRLPCRPYSLYGKVMTHPCPLVPTGSPTLPLPTRSPITSKPTQSPTVGIPTIAPTISRAPVGAAGSPTGSPTEPRPTGSPTTAEPSTSPVVPMRANVISVFRNVEDREMTDRESEKFVEIALAFLKLHTQESMVIDGIDVWHHKVIMVDSDEPARVAKTRDGNGHQVKGRQKEKAVPQVPAVEITMVLRIIAATLPLEYLGNLAAVTIDERQSELLSLLHEQSGFYSYFKDMDSIASRAVEVVTEVPTVRPTTYADYMASLEVGTNNDDDQEDDGGVGFVVFVGIGCGALWCCLTVVSVSYLMKRRAAMQEEHDMEDLLRQEKDAAGAIEGNDGEAAQEKDPAGSTDGDEEDPSDGGNDAWEENKDPKVATVVPVKKAGETSGTYNPVRNGSRQGSESANNGPHRGGQTTSSVTSGAGPSITGDRRRSSATSSSSGGERRRRRRGSSFLDNGSRAVSSLRSSLNRGSWSSNGSGGRASPGPSAVRQGRRQVSQQSKSVVVSSAASNAASSQTGPRPQYRPVMRQVSRSVVIPSSSTSRASAAGSQRAPIGRLSSNIEDGAERRQERRTPKRQSAEW